MPLSIGRSRVGFLADADGNVSPDSTPVSLAAHKLRAIVTPAGHKLGTITVTTSSPSGEFVDVAVPIPGLADEDEVATTLFLKDDWPLLDTRLHVEFPRAEAFEVFLITEPR